MKNRSRYLAQAALIAALYVVLSHSQNILLPNSASMAIQFRVSEALCVLAFFTPAAIPGLALGCMLFNFTFAGALPLDFLVGTLASLLAAVSMWKLQKHPAIGLAMPAIFNGILVGWELTVYIGEAFWLNALFVFIGEMVVLYTLGWFLYAALKRRNLYLRLFPRESKDSGR